MQLIPHLEFAKLKAMEADESTWHTLAARLNVGQLLAHRHFNEAEKIICRNALDAMVSIRDRHSKVGKWGGTGDELRDIGKALNLTDEMQKASTRRELRDTISHVYEVAGIKTKEEGIR